MINIFNMFFRNDLGGCSICLEPIYDRKLNQFFRWLPPSPYSLYESTCQHTYHLICMTNWISNGHGDNKSKCPQCRTVLEGRTFRESYDAWSHQMTMLIYHVSFFALVIFSGYVAKKVCSLIKIHHVFFPIAGMLLGSTLAIKILLKPDFISRIAFVVHSSYHWYYGTKEDGKGNIIINNKN